MDSLFSLHDAVSSGGRLGAEEQEQRQLFTAAEQACCAAATPGSGKPPGYDEPTSGSKQYYAARDGHKHAT